MNISRDEFPEESCANDRDDPRASRVPCAEIKAALSAYLDDELARSERFRVDAHLLECGKCRHLVERAEQLDLSLRADFDADLSDAAASIDSSEIDISAIQERILASIGTESRRRWTPRIAAAAAITAVAVGALFLWQSRNRADSLAPAGVGEFVRGERSTDPARELSIDAPSSRSTILASLSADDRQALYATSVILDAARRTAFADRARRTELGETARYDELVTRLSEVLPKLPVEDRATVALARDATLRIATAAESAEDWSRLQEDVTVGGLDRSVDELSDFETGDVETGDVETGDVETGDVESDAER